MKLTIAKVDSTLYSGDAESVTVPARAGEMTVLRDHMPLVAPLTKGKIVVREKEGVKDFLIDSGIIEVGKTEVTILL